MNKLKINFFAFIMLFLIIFTINIDVFEFITNLSYIYSFIFGFILTAILFIFIYKKVEIELKFEKNDIIFWLILLFFLIIQLPYPDLHFDTLNYHGYLQDNAFQDKINVDFFAGRCLNTYNIIFSNRIFYIFRFVLGFRLGPILNFILLAYVYYTLKDWFYKFGVKNKYLVTIFSSLCVFTTSILEIVATYYVDFLSAALILFLIDLTFRDNNTKIVNYLFFFISSVAFLTKVSNAYFIIFIGLFYLFKNYKMIFKSKVYDYILYVLIFLVPIIFYSYDSFVSTGNPFFPFFNSIFKSEYYFDNNWIDDGFGPYNFVESIFWPLVGWFNKDRVNDSFIFEFMWVCSYILIIINIIYLSINRKDKKFLVLNIFTLGLFAIWINFLIGYVRYAIVTLLLASLIYFVVLYRLIINLKNNKKFIKYLSFFGVIILLILEGFNLYTNYNDYLSNNMVGTIPNIFVTSKGQYLYNLKNLFKRYENRVELPEKSVWGLLNNNSLDAIFINKDVHIINLLNGPLTIEGKIKMNKLLSQYEHIYVPVTYSNFDTFFNYLTKFQFKIVDLYEIINDSAFYYNENIYIFEIAHDDNTFTEYPLFITHSEFDKIDEYNKMTFNLLSYDIYDNNKSMILHILKYKNKKVIGDEKIIIKDYYSQVEIDLSGCDKIVIVNSSARKSDTYFDVNRMFNLKFE